MKRFEAIKRNRQRLSTAFFNKLVHDPSLSSKDKATVNAYYARCQLKASGGGIPVSPFGNWLPDMEGNTGNNGNNSVNRNTPKSIPTPFATGWSRDLVNVGNVGKPPSKFALQSESSNTVCLPIEKYGRILGSGAYGCVYANANGRYAIKVFNDLNEFKTVEQNIRMLFPLLVENNLLNHTCFSGMDIDSIFPKDLQGYCMIKCSSYDENLNRKVELIQKFSNKGFVHGDVKMQNIMQHDGHPVLIDLDGMTHFMIINDQLCSSNTAEPIVTSVYAHPLFYVVQSVMSIKWKRFPSQSGLTLENLKETFSSDEFRNAFIVSYVADTHRLKHTCINTIKSYLNKLNKSFDTIHQVYDELLFADEYSLRSSYEWMRMMSDRNTLNTLKCVPFKQGDLLHEMIRRWNVHTRSRERITNGALPPDIPRTSLGPPPRSLRGRTTVR